MPGALKVLPPLPLPVLVGSSICLPAAFVLRAGVELARGVSSVMAQCRSLLVRFISLLVIS